MKTVSAVVVATFVGQAASRCANDCNGKGQCNALNQCDCFPNFRGPDCSFRVCPAGKAFVDTPLGDIDGEIRLLCMNYFSEALHGVPMQVFLLSAFSDMFHVLPVDVHSHQVTVMSALTLCTTRVSTDSLFLNFFTSTMHRQDRPS